MISLFLVSLWSGADLQLNCLLVIFLMPGALYAEYNRENGFLPFFWQNEGQQVFSFNWEDDVSRVEDDVVDGEGWMMSAKGDVAGDVSKWW